MDKPTPIIERRFTRDYKSSQDRGIRLLETREGEAGVRRIGGYAALYDVESVDLGWFREVIRKGAFSRAIRERHDVRCLQDHNPSLMLGRTKAGTLRLSEDDIGLKFEADLPDTQVANDLYENIRLGNVDQCSFAFMVHGREGAKWSADFSSREVFDLDLYDVSAVTYPAYESTSVEARSKGISLVRDLAMSQAKESEEPPLVVEPPRRSFRFWQNRVRLLEASSK